MTMILEDYITHVDRKVGAKKLENPTVIDQCAARLKNTTILRNTKVMCHPLKYGNYLCIQVQLQNAVHLKDCCHDRWQTATRCFMYEVG